LSERGHQVTIIADATNEETTSSAAAAFWYPFWTGDRPDHSWYRPVWAWETFQKLQALIDQPNSGVSPTALVEYFDSTIEPNEVQETIDSMWWRLMGVLKFRVLSSKEVAGISCGGRHFSSGTTFQTVVVNMSEYLPYLESLLANFRCSIREEHIVPRDLDALCRKFRFVINCTGLGARELVFDKAMTSVKGVVVHVAPVPGVQTIILVHTGSLFSSYPVYVVPRAGSRSDIVLGGTLGQGAEGLPRHVAYSLLDTEVSDVRDDARTILAMCQAIEPRIKGVKEISVSIGYRPSRKPMVRLEPELTGGHAGQIIHNYGHGGGGVTLSWGCAREVSKWVQWLAG
jgi:D-amino-acid oxidase